MRRIDQIVDAYYSDEVEALKKKARGSLKIATVTGFSSVILFAILGTVLFSSLIFQFNPLENPVLLVFLIIGIPASLALIPTTWFFAFRYIWACNKAKQAVDDIMRTSIQSGKAAQ